MNFSIEKKGFMIFIKTFYFKKKIQKKILI